MEQIFWNIKNILESAWIYQDYLVYLHIIIYKTKTNKKMDRFERLEMMCKSVIGNHIGGRPAYTLNHYKGTDDIGEYEYWDFHEVNQKGVPMFGFSDPHFDSFEESLTSYLNDLAN